jgi:hypothetical protein
MSCKDLGSPFGPNFGGFAEPQMGARHPINLGAQISGSRPAEHKKSRPKAASIPYEKFGSI